MRAVLIAFGDDLMFGDAGAAPRAPGHGIVPLIDPATIVTLFQEVPDGVVVLVGHGEVRVVPIHPVAKPDRLFGDPAGVLPDPLLAAIDELGDAIGFDIALRFQSQLFFDFDLHPEALAVEPVLIALFLAEHCLEPLKEILVCAAPSVVHAHGIIGGDRTVDERERFRRADVPIQIGLHDPVLGPPGENFPLHGGEIGFGLNFLKRCHAV